jgi:hypothetical protein
LRVVEYQPSPLSRTDQVVTSTLAVVIAVAVIAAFVLVPWWDKLVVIVAAMVGAGSCDVTGCSVSGRPSTPSSALTPRRAALPEALAPVKQ